LSAHDQGAYEGQAGVKPHAVKDTEVTSSRPTYRWKANTINVIFEQNLMSVLALDGDVDIAA
jgi:hypothetical protein